MGITNLNDESILRLYDNIRVQVDADRGSKHKFTTGDSVKQYAATARGTDQTTIAPHDH